MARFGTFKFGQAKFGESVLDSPKYALEVDWTKVGVFGGTAEFGLREFSIERGRRYTVAPNGEMFEEEETGKFKAVLYDLAGKYNAYNTESPLYGLLSGGKYFRLTFRTVANNIGQLMSGILSDPESFTDGKVPMAGFSGEDGWGFLRDQSGMVTIPLQEAIYVDDAMGQILDAAGWPTVWGRELDAGVDLRQYYWVDARSPARALHELAHNELGTLAITAEGAFRYRSRLSLESDVTTIRHEDCLSVRRMTPKEVIRNIIKIETRPRSERALQAVWELPGYLEINPGETIDDIWAEYEFNNATVPVKNPLTPVATTDYLAYENSDGSGSNLTANISVTLYSFSTRGRLAFTNNGLVKAYVTWGQVRGIPVAASNTATFEYEDASSVAQFGPRPFTLTIDQNLNVARQYRELLGLFMTSARNYLEVELMPNSEKQYIADLGDVVLGDFEQLGITQSFRVMRISHRHKGVLTFTTWLLEPYQRLFAGVQIPFQVPFQLGGVS